MRATADGQIKDVRRHADFSAAVVIDDAGAAGDAGGCVGRVAGCIAGAAATQSLVRYSVR